jgi:hypothetical protein
VIVLAAALAPPPPPIAGAHWGLPTYLSPPLLLESELDTTFASADAWFLDSFRASNHVSLGESHLRPLNDVEYDVEKNGDGMTMWRLGSGKLTAYTNMLCSFLSLLNC